MSYIYFFVIQFFLSLTTLYAGNCYSDSKPPASVESDLPKLSEEEIAAFPPLRLSRLDRLIFNGAIEDWELGEKNKEKLSIFYFRSLICSMQLKKKAINTEKTLVTYLLFARPLPCAYDMRLEPYNALQFSLVKKKKLPFPLAQMKEKSTIHRVRFADTGV